LNVTVEPQRTRDYDTYDDLYRQFYARKTNSGKAAGYSGRTMVRQIGYIRNLCRGVNAQTLLDYGCGRAQPYEWRNFEIGKANVASLQEYLGVRQITLFDPAVESFSSRPQGRSDFVTCTDVLEHVPENNVPWVLRDIVNFADKAVFIAIACYPARVHLSNGENAHATVRSKAWWKQQILAVLHDRPDLKVHILLRRKTRITKDLSIRWSQHIRINC
jgi:hypothetical protein